MCNTVRTVPHSNLTEAKAANCSFYSQLARGPLSTTFIFDDFLWSNDQQGLQFAVAVAVCSLQFGVGNDIHF
jgi:hypothetical protein